MLGELRGAVDAFRQHADQFVNIRASSGARRLLDASPVAAELKGNFAES